MNAPRPPDAASRPSAPLRLSRNWHIAAAVAEVGLLLSLVVLFIMLGR